MNEVERYLTMFLWMQMVQQHNQDRLIYVVNRLYSTCSTSKMIELDKEQNLYYMSIYLCLLSWNQRIKIFLQQAMIHFSYEPITKNVTHICHWFENNIFSLISSSIFISWHYFLSFLFTIYFLFHQQLLSL